MPDLTEPGWRPKYTGDETLGDVGSGPRLGAHLYYLYRAGRNELPEVASVYARLTSQIHGIVGAMQTQFDRPGLGMHQAHLWLLELRNEAHDVLRQTCLRMQEAGAALMKIADSYAATDRAATAEFSRLLSDNAYADRSFAPPVPTPPQVDDPPPSAQRHDLRLGGR